MHYQVVFPYLTGLILFVAAVYVYLIYSRTANKALLILAAGFVFVGLESVLDGVTQTRLISLAGGDWDKLPQSSVSGMLALDAVRGVFIVLWAAAEAAFGAYLVGTEKKLYTTYIPLAIIVVGVIETFALNYSSIEPLHKRILISSAGRVLGLLVPVALIVGFYILFKLWMPLRTASALYYALGFIIHGLTLPTYSFAKEKGALTLGLWYFFGGVIPALLAMVGTYYLYQEFKQAAAEAAEAE